MATPTGVQKSQLEGSSGTKRSSAGPRALRKALASRADRSEYLVWERAVLRADADDSAANIGCLYPGEIVACVQRVGLEPACWMYVHRLRRLPPRSIRSGWVQESSRLGLRCLDKLSIKERTTPAAIGDLKLLRETTHDRSWYAVEERIATLEADALHRGGCRSAARVPVRKVPGAEAATAASACIGGYRIHAERQQEVARAEHRKRLASGALSIVSGRLPPSRYYWRQHGIALNERSVLDPATVGALYARGPTETAVSQVTSVATTMEAQDVPPMLQRLLQVRRCGDVMLLQCS